MGARKFPLPDTPEFLDIKVRWENNEVELTQLGKELGMTPKAVKDRLSLEGIKRKRGVSYKPIERETPIVNLPPVNIKQYKIPDKEGDEEVVVLHASDGHAGKITKSFNKDIYRDRMGRMFESTITIVKLHRKMYPIRKVVVVNTGDNNQGESPHQGSVIGDVEMGARDQVKYIAAPMWNDVLGSLKQHFDEVEMQCYPGNHGHDKLAPATSSYDLMLYDILEAGIGQQQGITINIHEQFGDIIDINGFRVFASHMDGIPCAQGVPYFGINRKLKAWYIQLGGFDYALGGHFHKRMHDEVTSRFDYYGASTLVSDDEWALKKLGISSNPSQGIYGVHPKRGITWNYGLVVDDRFKVEV